MKDERLESKMEGKTNSSRHLNQLAWLGPTDPIPWFYDRCCSVNWSRSARPILFMPYRYIAVSRMRQAVLFKLTVTVSEMAK